MPKRCYNKSGIDAIHHYILKKYLNQITHGNYR